MATIMESLCDSAREATEDTEDEALQDFPRAMCAVFRGASQRQPFSEHVHASIGHYHVTVRNRLSETAEERALARAVVWVKVIREAKE